MQLAPLDPYFHVGGEPLCVIAPPSRLISISAVDFSGAQAIYSPELFYLSFFT
jgi:hypothetical protein